MNQLSEEVKRQRREEFIEKCNAIDSSYIDGSQKWKNHDMIDRFLRARDYNVDKALEMYINYIVRSKTLPPRFPMILKLIIKTISQN